MRDDEGGPRICGLQLIVDGTRTPSVGFADISPKVGGFLFCAAGAFAAGEDVFLFFHPVKAHRSLDTQEKL